MAHVPSTSQFASIEDVEAKASEWNTKQLNCRTYGHHWTPLRAHHYTRERYIRVEHLCDSCHSERVTEMSERGHVFASWINYAEGYLSQGIGRIVGDAKDLVRLTAVTRMFSVEKVTAKNQQETPRSFAARDAIAERHLKAV